MPAPRKLTIEFPDWAEGKPIHIFVAGESYMHVGEDGVVYRKISRCRRCGECCQMEMGDRWIYPKYEIDGRTYCVYVKKMDDGTFQCTNSLCPFECCSDNPSNRKHKGKANPECSIEYEIVV